MAPKKVKAEILQGVGQLLLQRFELDKNQTLVFRRLGFDLLQQGTLFHKIRETIQNCPLK
jgi:hypothetical protein